MAAVPHCSARTALPGGTPLSSYSLNPTQNVIWPADPPVSISIEIETGGISPFTVKVFTEHMVCTF